MTGQLESIDELQAQIVNATKFRLDDRDIKFSPNFIQTLKAALARHQRNFIVTSSTIQWDGRDGSAIVPAALVFCLSQFSEYLSRLYKYHEIWNKYRNELASKYDTWRGMTHNEIHQKFLPTIISSGELTNSDIALFAEWLAPPEHHVSKKFGLKKEKINEKNGFSARSDLFENEVCGLLPFTNDGGGKTVGKLAEFFAEAHLLADLNNPSNFIIGVTDTAEPSIASEVPRNLIYYGAPGTGKSHQAEMIIPCEPEHFHRVVFHADYQNADFVGSIKPAIRGEDSASYVFEKGPFTEALIDALSHPDSPVVLLIEELNRGNAASIFGEIFQLLDRSSNGNSKFPIRITGSLLEAFKGIEAINTTKKLSLPSNFFIIGTMNTSDQAVFPLDTAFKRRWTMKHMPIDWTKLSTAGSRYAQSKITMDGNDYTWAELGQAINSVMESKLPNVPEDRYLGPFFLSPDELLLDQLNEVVAGKVLIYLWDDVVKYEQKQALFAAGIGTFQQLQEQFNRGERVFSDDVNQRLTELRSERIDPQDSLEVEFSDEDRQSDSDVS